MQCHKNNFLKLTTSQFLKNETKKINKILFKIKFPFYIQDELCGSANAGQPRYLLDLASDVLHRNSLEVAFPEKENGDDGGRKEPIRSFGSRPIRSRETLSGSRIDELPRSRRSNAFHPSRFALAL